MLQFIAHRYKYGIFGQFFQNSKEIGDKIRFDSPEDAEKYAFNYFGYELNYIRGCWVGKTLYVTRHD